MNANAHEFLFSENLHLASTVLRVYLDSRKCVSSGWGTTFDAELNEFRFLQKTVHNAGARRKRASKIVSGGVELSVGKRVVVSCF